MSRSVATIDRQALRLRRLALEQTFRPLVSVSDVLSLPGFAGSCVVAGELGLGRPVEQVNVIQIPTDRYVKRNELVLAPATVFRGSDGNPAELVGAIAHRGVAALCIRGAPLGRLLGRSGCGVAMERELPLIELSASCHLNELQTEVLELIVDARTKQLKRTREIRSLLADHILSGGGLEGIPQDIVKIVGGDVALVGRDGEILAASAGADRGAAQLIGQAWMDRRTRRPAQTEDGWIAWPVLAGSRRVGCLVARFREQHDRLQWAALQQGATFAALQILHRQEAAEADARFRAGFIRDLLRGTLDADAARRRALAIGWSPNWSFEILLLAADGHEPHEIADGVRDVAPAALVTEHGNGCLVMCPSSPPGGDPAHAGARWTVLGEGHLESHELAFRLCESSENLHVGISADHTGLQALPVAVAEAKIALRVSKIFHCRARIRRFGELGVLRFLIEVPEGELRDFQSSVLRPLDDVEGRYGDALLRTLELFVQSNLNVAETARRGGWHYNTVRSRIRRLRDLLGPFTDSGTLFDSLCLALLLRRELEGRRPAETSAEPAEAPLRAVVP